MASWANPDEGPCPQCGHLNSRQWIMCDKCGERLPWAPAETGKKKVQDMTEEELAAMFGGPVKQDSFLSLESREVRAAFSALILIVLFFVGYLIARGLNLV